MHSRDQVVPSFLDQVWAGLDLPTAGNVGSIIGALFTFIAFIAQFRKRRQYMLLIRGKEVQKNLADIGERLNEYDSLSTQEQKTVLGKTSTHLATAAKYLSWGDWLSLWWTRVSVYRHQTRATGEQVENYYATVQTVIIGLDNRIRDQQVKQ